MTAIDLARSASECISTKTGNKVANLAGIFALLFCIGCQPSKPAPVQTQVVNPKASTEKNSTAPAEDSPSESPSNAVNELSDDLQTQAWESLQRGLDWLMAQQAEDGGWHSKTYGSFKGGAATTALALYAGSQLQVDLRCQRSDAWKRGWKFLEPGVREKGFVVCPDGTMDEPVYATALVLLVQRRLQLSIDTKLLEDFLLRERCAKERGFKPDDPNYGGWDLAGGSGLQGETPGSNVSITRFATLALSRAHALQQSQEDEIIAWIMRVQNSPGDGGFFFHPQRDHEGNKAQWADGDDREHPRSYGTATCDGVMLLRWAKGSVAEDDQQKVIQRNLQAALQWLVDHPAVDRVPGFEDAPPEIGWQQGLLFYYLMSLSQVLPELPEEVARERREAIIKQLLAMQKEDGRWQNESARMREDDPLIATSFALVALSEALKK